MPDLPYTLPDDYKAVRIDDLTNNNNNLDNLQTNNINVFNIQELIDYLSNWTNNINIIDGKINHNINHYRIYLVNLNENSHEWNGPFDLNHVILYQYVDENVNFIDKFIHKIVLQNNTTGILIGIYSIVRNILDQCIDVLKMKNMISSYHLRLVEVSTVRYNILGRTNPILEQQPSLPVKQVSQFFKSRNKFNTILRIEPDWSIDEAKEIILKKIIVRVLDK